MKEVFIRVNKTNVKWNGPKTSGSEPILDGNKDEVLGRVLKFLNQLSDVRNEEWSFRFVFQNLLVENQRLMVPEKF